MAPIPTVRVIHMSAYPSPTSLLRRRIGPSPSRWVVRLARPAAASLASTLSSATLPAATLTAAAFASAALSAASTFSHHNLLG